MDVINIINTVGHKLGDNLKFKYIFLGGSQIWQCKNPHDMDIIVILEEPWRDKKNNINCMASIRLKEQDIIIMSYDYWQKTSYHYYIDIILLSLYPKYLLFGTWSEPIKLSQENLNDLLIRAFKSGKRNYFVFQKSKNAYWLFMAYYIYLNNGSINFTQEQWDIIQKCHDRELPISYRDELKANMEKILKENGFSV